MFATYFPYSELNNGQPSTFDQFKSELSHFSRTRLLHLCSTLNAILRSEDDYPVNRRAHDGLVRLFFEPNISNFLLANRGEVRFTLHRQQILFVAKIAILYGNDDGALIGPNDYKRLGRIFLMAGDHLPHVGTKPDSIPEKFAYFAAQLLPVQEASGFHRFDHKFTRSYLMLSDAPKLQGQADAYWDVAADFHRLTEVPLLTFQSLLFGSLAKFQHVDLHAFLQDPQAYALEKQWFLSTSIAEGTVDKFLKLVSATPDELKASFERRNWGPSDFTPFREKPLFRDGEKLFLIDYAFLAETFETAPFWTVHNSLPDNQTKDLFHGFWGRVFELYGCNILTKAVKNGCARVYASPKFKDKTKGQVCDAILTSGNSAAFIEFKGATFSSRSKYGSDYGLLMTELTKKLVIEEPKAKAVYQLKRAIELTCDKVSPEEIEGIDLTKIKTVYPVIVTRDDIGSVFGINGFLQVRFESVVNRRSFNKTITPLYCLNSEDLEHLTAYFDKHCLPDLLFAYYKAVRTRGSFFLTPYFATRGNAILRQMGFPKPQVMLAAWEELTGTALQHLGIREA